jgi:histidine triad (HIT) family protein
MGPFMVHARVGNARCQDDVLTCILCAIAGGAEPAEVISEDTICRAITPLRPMAPVHVLLFPRAHAADFPSYLEGSPASAGSPMRPAAHTARQFGLEDRGYRLAWNFGPDTNQRIGAISTCSGGRPLAGRLG